jgi:hypothetical protein
MFGSAFKKFPDFIVKHYYHVQYCQIVWDLTVKFVNEIFNLT